MIILFLCVANSARSQLAEGLARNIFPEAEVLSAGSNPGKLNSYAVATMKEIGIDISGHYSKSINDIPPETLSDINYIITLCAEEVCPILVGSKAKKLHWPFPDPASKMPLPEIELLQRFRECRDALQAKLQEFKAEVSL